MVGANVSIPSPSSDIVRVNHHASEVLGVPQREMIVHPNEGLKRPMVHLKTSLSAPQWV